MPTLRLACRRHWPCARSTPSRRSGRAISMARCEISWRGLPAAAKQQLRDNVYTFLGQVHEARKPYSAADMPLIKTPTLLIGGAVTTGSPFRICRVMSGQIAGAQTAIIPKARHWMFESNPQEFCRAAMEFLAA